MGPSIRCVSTVGFSAKYWQERDRNSSSHLALFDGHISTVLGLLGNVTSSDPLKSTVFTVGEAITSSKNCTKSAKKKVNAEEAEMVHCVPGLWNCKHGGGCYGLEKCCLLG